MPDTVTEPQPAETPSALSCTECGHIDQPEYWHFTSEHEVAS